MAVAIKQMGFPNIKIYNGGLKDWIKAGNSIHSISPLPKTKINAIDVDELMAIVMDADTKNCVDAAGRPILTLIDFRTNQNIIDKKGADKYQIKTTCKTIKAVLDDFIDNEKLIQSIPDDGLTLSISETGNRDEFLIRYLSQFGKTKILSLKYGMRNWLKANYPVEEVTPAGD